jgi:hypothetical protein
MKAIEYKIIIEKNVWELIFKSLCAFTISIEKKIFVGTWIGVSNGETLILDYADYFFVI